MAINSSTRCTALPPESSATPSLVRVSNGPAFLFNSIDHRGSTRKVSICGRNIDSDPTGET
ncbi:MAG: hypothetical protein ACFFCW_18030, partial [Candidatus Hodarchaeota archaeon]